MIAAAFVAYLALLWEREGVNAGGSDSSGYANNAKLLREGRLFAEQRRLPGVEGPTATYTYVPLGFVPAGEGRMAPTYPLGLSALYVAASLGGPLDRGMPLAIWAMAGASLLATYGLARQFDLAPGWAALCGGVLAACPLFQYMALQGMSDMPAMLWAMLVLMLAWASRRRRWLAPVAGLVFAVTVFLRPSNALLLLPLAWAFGLDWRRWLGFGLGGLPGGLLWAWCNHELFGRYVATGYGAVHLMFGREWIAPSLRNYAETLPWLLPLGLFLPFGLRRAEWPPERRAVLGLALTWIVVCAGFYVFYRCTGEVWWYLRFILPVFPFLIVLSVIGLRSVVARLRGAAPSPWRAWTVGVAAVVTVGASGVAQTVAGKRWDALGIGVSDRIYPEVCDWTVRHLPAESVLFSMQVSGALFYAVPNIVVRWDDPRPDQLRALYAAAAREGRPVYAVLFPFEIEDWGCFSKGRLPGRWTQVGAVRHITIWRLDDPAGTMEPPR